MPTTDPLFRRVALRLIPLMVGIYAIGWLDRVNVGFAALTMNRDLAFSPTVFGAGAGAFFLGYLVLQIPGNLGFAHFGARAWMFSSMLIWGVLSAATAFVHGAMSFYALRFALGLAEAGFFPGLVFYLTLWFPQRYRARFTAAFMAAIPLSTIVGAPLSTSLLSLDGAAGLHGWQWLFLVEGLPACGLAIACLKLLPAGPGSALWLNDAERRTIADALAADPKPEDRGAVAVLDGRLAALCFASVALGFAGYGINLWLPQILQTMGYSNAETGGTIAALSLAGMVAMIAWARSSDARAERVWHVALPLILAALGFLAAGIAGTGLPALAAFACIAVGFLAADGPFFALPTSFLRGANAVIGIALMNATGSLGAFLGPLAVGILRERSGGYGIAMVALAMVLASAALAVLVTGRRMGSSGEAMRR